MWALFILSFVIFVIMFVNKIECEIDTSIPMSKAECKELREEARDMFYHAYNAYMENAYPADELMPLSCSGRYRSAHSNRGDIDETLGNFSLTLIDTLDTLVVLGDITEFEHAVKLIISSVSFDNDVVVSVFETNIRVLGGLLSGHVLAEYLQQRHDEMGWYSGELLQMAKDLGYRLLPAFNTSTGIPHGKINLRHGLKSHNLEGSRETCTACAGTMVLEMAALSRLTGEPIFEEKAHRAMDELWRLRHRSSDLMGTVLNVYSGDWIRRDSGVGAGIDSYYEYCLKAYILLGDNRYLGRFNKHYSAVMKYISNGPLLLDVHMHRPNTNSRNYMDALLAFWPGLQVLQGDLKPAVETHEMLYQVMKRHTFIPEAFTIDFQVHWGQHPLRPEFLESTYFLHRATGDPHYLHVGKMVLKSLQKYARVPCGYAAVKDVRTGLHEDRMDSFVLAETFKYLFLLFAEPDDLVVNMDEFLFTTEAHLLPLSLARRNSNLTVFTVADAGGLEDGEYSRQCPSSLRLFPESVRKPLRNMVDGVCPHMGSQSRRKLLASQFQHGNEEHLKLLKDMGITLTTLSNGRVHMFQNAREAKTASDADEGLMFLKEMNEIAKSHTLKPIHVSFFKKDNLVTLPGCPANFGPQMNARGPISGLVGVADPVQACSTLTNVEFIRGRIVIVERGKCMFVEKTRRLAAAGAIGCIIIDSASDSSFGSSQIFSMSGDQTDDVGIPVVFLYSLEGLNLLITLANDPSIFVTISDGIPDFNELKSMINTHSDESTLDKIKRSIIQFMFSAKSDSVVTQENKNDPKTEHTTSKSTDTPAVYITTLNDNDEEPSGKSNNQKSIETPLDKLNKLISEGTNDLPSEYEAHLRKIYFEKLSKPSQKWLKDNIDWKLNEVSIDQAHISNSNISSDIEDRVINSDSSSFDSSAVVSEESDNTNSENDNDSLVQVDVTPRNRIRKIPDEL